MEKKPRLSVEFCLQIHVCTTSIFLWRVLSEQMKKHNGYNETRQLILIQEDM